jgi:hypothetical protein
MKSAGRMIDRAAQMCGSKSEVARRLQVSPQTLYNWETGRRSMPDEQIDALAHMIGWDPIKALGEYHHEWLRKKTASSAPAGIAALAFFLVAATTAVQDAKALERTLRVGSPDIHYAKFVAWLRQLIASSLRRDGRRKAAPTCSQATPVACKV